MAPGELTGEELRQQTVQVLRENPNVTKDLVHTAAQLSWRNRDVLLAGGSMLSKTADTMLAAQGWLDKHPGVKTALNELGQLAGFAMWVKNFTPIGALTALAVNYGYNQLLDIADIDTAKEKFAAYLTSQDQDLNKEQADVLASATVNLVKEMGRVGMQGLAARGYSGWVRELGKKAWKIIKLLK